MKDKLISKEINQKKKEKERKSINKRKNHRYVTGEHNITAIYIG